MPVGLPTACRAPPLVRSHSPAPLTPKRTQVRGLWWSADDSCLVTAGADGAVYEWRVLEGRRARDFVQKGWAYTALASGTCGVWLAGCPCSR